MAKPEKEPAAVPAETERFEIPSAEERTVGHDLRDKRVQLGLKQKDVAEQIKIKPRYLQALEDNNWNEFPAPAYARMFARAYADFLGLDVDEVLAFYDTCEAMRPSRNAVPASGARGAGAAAGGRPTDEAADDEAAGTGGGAKRTLGIIFGIVVIAVAAVWIGLSLWGGAEEPAADLGTPPPDSAIVPVDTVPALPWGWIDPEEPFLLRLLATMDTWAYVVADGDTIFNRVIPRDQVREVRAAGDFRLKVGKPEGLVGTLNDYPMIAFVDVQSVPSGWLITRDNYLDWLDSAQTDAAGELLPVVRDESPPPTRRDVPSVRQPGETAEDTTTAMPVGGSPP